MNAQITWSLSTMKQVALALCAVAMLALPACNSKKNGDGNGAGGDKKRIVFLTNGDDPFWDACRKGMDDAAKELKIEEAGLTHVMDKGSEFKNEKQLEKQTVAWLRYRDRVFNDVLAGVNYIRRKDA